MIRMTLTPFKLLRITSTSKVVCACCQTTLDRHQPDLKQPDRLLGTCRRCGAWYLIDSKTNVMFALPDPSGHSYHDEN
jgi:hypothetical protein